MSNQVGRGEHKTIWKGRIAMRWIDRAWFMMAQSTVEYALVGALVVIAAATAMTALGTDVTAVFNKISTTLGAAK